METGLVPKAGSAPSPARLRAAALIVAALSLALVAPSTARAQEAEASRAVPVTGGEPGHRGTTWDLDIHGGYGAGFGDDELEGSLFAGRVRAGVLAVQEPRFYALGATLRLSSELPASFGVEAEYLNTETGLWFAPGVFLDTSARPGASVSFGYSLLGVSAEGRLIEGGELGGSIIALLRLPLGVIFWAASQP